MKIVASGGFNADRIRAFEAARVPVDAYGVGSALIRGSNDFTADVVLVDGRPCAKVGREYRPTRASAPSAGPSTTIRQPTDPLEGGVLISGTKRTRSCSERVRPPGPRRRRRAAGRRR